MANVISTSKINVSATLVLDEPEIRMLIELVGYGVKPFLKGYYKILGKSYLEPHEAAVKSFFNSINRNLPPHIKRIDKARKAFNGEDE